LAATIEFAARVIASQKAAFRYDIVWEKRRATGFYNARRMPLRAHEHVLVFGTGARTYNPQMSSGHRPINAYRRREGAHGANYNAGTPEKQTRSGATDRMPRSVVRTSSDAHNTGRRHHQQKPLALGLYLVATYSNAGDLIVDPYAGSGRFGDAAEQLGRSFIGFDIDPEWGSGAPRKS
jgi:site-specific DNA-methyltransferase (adenine-specific)